jgi:dTDP-4-amino-4,6-dideoxygalactose transaminase
MKVPFADLGALHREVREEVERLIAEIIDQSSFIGGPYVKTFEESFADYCGTRFAVSCASGTDALKLALMAAGVGPDEEVITVPHTFVATIEAVIAVGAHPVFVDIEKDTYNLSTDRLAEFLEKNCRFQSDGQLVNKESNRPVTAVIPVHLYGLAVDMEPILALAERFGLKVIEDAAQAHGALYSMNGEEKQAGTFGEAGAFSFYPGKNLGAMGEGGAVVTDDPEKDRRMRVWRDHGQSEKYLYVSPRGWNIRLDALQCAVLNAKLPRLNDWNEGRRQAARWYRERLQDDRILLPVEPAGRKHVYHVFVVRVPDRLRVSEDLSSRGIQTGLHYPISLHLQEGYRYLGYQEGDFPEAEAAAESILSLPMFPHMTEAQVDCVCTELLSVLS